MRLKWLSVEEITDRWADIGEQVYLATRHDPTYSINDLYFRLKEQTALIFEASEGAAGYIVIAVDHEGAELVAWTVAIVGKFDGRPKDRLKKMRFGMAEVEKALRAGGCSKHRICGRDYMKIFPDYAPFEGARNGLEKVL